MTALRIVLYCFALLTLLACLWVGYEVGVYVWGLVWPTRAAEAFAFGVFAAVVFGGPAAAATVQAVTGVEVRRWPV